jgi:hypothetical protein
MPTPVDGFGDNNVRKKHFQKHVQGKRGGKGWVADMPDRFGSAEEYERAGRGFMEATPTWPPVVELADAVGKVFRWDMATKEFGVVEPTSGGRWRLVTYHTRASEPFLEALHNHRPDIFPRVIKFEHKETLAATITEDEQMTDAND